MKNKIGDMRNLMFETIEGLLDKDEPLEIKRAEAVAKVGTVIVNSAKVEVDFMKALGLDVETSDFIAKPKLNMINEKNN